MRQGSQAAASPQLRQSFSMFASTITLTLIGGPTVLIEFQEFRVLTDPTFDPPGHYQGSYSPVKFVKTTGPALPPDQIGRIDAVLQ